VAALAGICADQVMVPPPAVGGNEVAGAELSYIDPQTIPVLGPVVRSVDPSNCSITNTTLPGHLLYPGQVTRSVVNDNGMISIVTDGTGDGALAGPNDWLAYPVWSTVDGNIFLVHG
jgi:hypothetical protein